MDEITLETEFELCSKWHDLYTYLKGGNIPEEAELKKFLYSLTVKDFRIGVLEYLDMKKRLGIWDYR